MTMQISVYTLGLIDYPSAEALQKKLAQEIAAERHPPTLLLLEHPHVYTFGRQGKQENLLWSAEELDKRGITLHWTDRGGDITYHGPGQLVGYPILPLADLDTLGYLRKLEAVIIQTLAFFGIQAIRVEGQTGVWVAGGQDNLPPAKIASIGVRVDANRITRHGFALNVAPDMTYWKGMIACGLENQAKTSMANLMPKPTSVQQVTPQVIDRFSEVFNARLKVGVLPEIPGLNWHRKV
jgi:lipoyl(octanoyl) transferase